jgi:hypothetical protein
MIEMQLYLILCTAEAVAPGIRACRRRSSSASPSLPLRLPGRQSAEGPIGREYQSSTPSGGCAARMSPVVPGCGSSRG